MGLISLVAQGLVRQYYHKQLFQCALKNNNSENFENYFRKIGLVHWPVAGLPLKNLKIYSCKANIPIKQEPWIFQCRYKWKISGGKVLSKALILRLCFSVKCWWNMSHEISVWSNLIGGRKPIKMLETVTWKFPRNHYCKQSRVI